MMKVKIQISTSTKNSTVNAVGNLNLRFGLAFVFSGVACVSVAIMPAPGQLGWPARHGTGGDRPGLQARCVVPASFCAPPDEDRETLTPAAFLNWPGGSSPPQG